MPTRSPTPRPKRQRSPRVTAAALDAYQHKRDFRKTREPAPRRPKPRAKPVFVIQEHHASHHHFDFRLEADGVLKSWAIPKGPSIDPAIKRLAIHVEDHPLEYAKFHGDIPAGQYGAGHVEIWDKGTYINLMALKPQPHTLAESLAHGHIEVDLRGRKLRGPFALVRMGPGNKNWLLIKMKNG